MSAPKLNDLGAQIQAADIAVEMKVTKGESRYVFFARTVTMPLLIVKNKNKQNKTQVGLCGLHPWFCRVFDYDYDYDYDY